MPLHLHRAVVVACALAPILFAIPGTASADEVFAPSAQVTVPGVPMGSWDISFVDPSLGLFFLGDRTHNAVDVVNTGKPPSFSHFIGQGSFAGVVPAATCAMRGGGPGPNDCNGPNGVLTTNHTELWASDGNSTVKVFDLTTPGNPLIATISTNGKFRGDEMCFDPEHQLVMVANNSQADHNSVLNSDGPFASIISVKSHAIVKQIAFDGTKGAPKSTNGAEQCSWSPKTEKFYITIPGVNNPDDGTGVVAVIDPEDLDDNVQKVFAFKNTDCDTPQGTAKGPAHQLLVGCNGSTHSTNSIIINDQSGQIMARVPNESGPDEVWFNPGDDQYFLGISGGLAGTQLLGVIDARGMQADQSVYTANKPNPPAASSHSVAADPVHNQVFVAIGGKGSSTVCGSQPGGSDAQGCIAAYTAPHDDRCLVAEGAPIVTASAGDDDAEFMHGHCRR
jgi:hypothetical protein